MGGSGAARFLKVILQNFDVLAGPVLSLAYPLYASVRAIETKNPVDDQQWLSYWILYSMITLFELTFAKVLEWIPIWPYAKLIATCWLVLPYFSGAAYVYEHFLRPLFVDGQTVNVLSNLMKKDLFHKSEPQDIITATEKYIRENGSGEFRRLIDRSENEARSRNTGFVNHRYYTRQWHDHRQVNPFDGNFP